MSTKLQPPGVCHYITGRASCWEPATHHILVDGDACSWACDKHLDRALAFLKPQDHHSQGPLCTLSTEDEPRLRWHYSTPEHEGFCHIDEGDLLEQLGITVHVPLGELVGA